MKKAVLLMSAFTFLSACGGIKGENYLQAEPAFKLEEYFNGPIKAWGVIQDRSGNVLNRFEAEIHGRWEGNEGVLDEVFTYYNSGEKQTRTWHITKVDELHYQGTAGDIIGTAQGRAYGNAIRWTYEMDVPVDDSKYRMKFDDWIWAMDGEVIINRSYLKKFGITFAELTIFMQKQ